MAERTVGFRLRLGADEQTFKTIKELKTELKNVNNELDNTTKGTKAYDQLNESAAKLKAEISATRKEQRRQQKDFEALKFAEGSYRALNAELVKNRNAFKELSAQELKTGRISDETVKRLGLTTNSVKDLTKEVNRLDKALKQTDETIGLYQRNVGNYKSANDGLFGSFSKLAGGIGGAFAAFGGTQIITDFVGEIVMASDEIIKVQSRLRGFNIPTDSIDQFAARITAISNTFDKESDEVLNAANAFSKQFGISFEESTTLIEQGLAAGLDVNGDFLDLLQEYPVQFRQAGFSAEEFLGVIDRQIDQGVFSDKGLDLVKEFGLRISEQSQGAKDALENAFGKEFTQGLFDNINDGSLNAKDALGLVATELDNTELPAKELQEVISNVFGAQGEDVGVEFIKSLKDIGSEVGDLVDATDAYQSRQQRILEANKDLAESQVELSNVISGGGSAFEEFTITLKTFVIDTILAFIRALEPVFDSFRRLGSAFSSIIGLFGDFDEEGESTISLVDILTSSFTFFANTISFVVDILASIIQGIADFVESVPFLKGAVEFIGDAFSEVGEQLSLLPATLSGVKAAFFQIGANIRDFFKKFILDLRIFGNQINQYNPFSSQTEQEIDQNIENLRRQREAIVEEYKTISEAFQEAFEEQRDQIIAANEETTAVVENTDLETQPVDTSKTQKSLSDLREKLQEEIEAAKNNIEELKIALIDDQFDREIADLTKKAKDQISELAGTPDQIKEQTDLINKILKKQTDEVNKERKEALEEREKDIADALKRVQSLIDSQQAETTGSKLSQESETISREIQTLEFQVKIDRNAIEAETLAAKEKLLNDLEEGIITEQTFNQKFEEVRRERAARILEVEKQSYEVEKLLLQEQGAQRIEQLFFRRDQEIAALETQRTEALAKLQEDLDNELITEENFELAKTAILERETQRRAEITAQYNNEAAAVQEATNLANLESQQAFSEQQFQIELEKNERIRAEQKKTADFQKQIIGLSLDFFGTFVSGIKDLLEQDEENREKNAKAIKALAISEILINLFKELALIAINASQAGSAAGPAAPGVAAAVYAVQAAIAIARAGFGIAKVSAQKAEEGVAVIGESSSDSVSSQAGNIQTVSPTGNIPDIGTVTGNRHSQGGVKGIFSGNGIEVESGEFIVRNGKDTYIVNRKSSHKFRTPLNSLARKSPNRYSPQRKAQVSAINSYKNWGVRFQQGGVLNTTPSTAPTISDVSTSQQPIADRFDKTIDVLTKSIVSTQQGILSNSERIDNIRVINDPEETVEAANTQQENKRVDNLTLDT